MAKLYICMTCDWEGRSEIFKYYENMEKFQVTIPDIPITHFITPRSYGETLRDVIEKGKVIKAIDEIGLHIHCWNDLLVQIDEAIALEAKGLQQRIFTSTKADGKDTPLVAFTDLPKIVKWFFQKLYMLSGVSPVSFRAGAWFASDSVYEALVGCGIKYDSSPLPFELIKYPDPLINGFLQNLWGLRMNDSGNALTWQQILNAIEISTQPYALAGRGHGLQVFPMTWGMDVTTKVDWLEGWAKAEGEKVKKDQNRFVNLGFHDTLVQNGWPDRAIKMITATLDTEKVPYQFVTLSDAAKALG